jgi:uncharacterized integral membrane protein (TIGR00697 family)
MMNEIYWLIMMVANFALILLAFRLWGKAGMLIWCAMAVIVANMQVTKTVMLFGIEATLGNIVYGTCFLATDILSEFYSKKEADKAVHIGFFSLIAMTVLMQLALLFKPASSDYGSAALNSIFSIMPRITIGSLTAYIVSNLLDIELYFMFMRKFPKQLWLRNNLSTITAQALDTVMFTLISFYGVYENDVLWRIMLSTYLLKFIVAACDTPFLYLARKMTKKGIIGDLKVEKR